MRRRDLSAGGRGAGFPRLAAEGMSLFVALSLWGHRPQTDGSIFVLRFGLERSVETISPSEGGQMR